MPSQPSLQDFSAPFDPTAFAQITQAELLQLIEGATPLFDDKGLTITTLDDGVNPIVPDATQFTKWQNYIWRRVGATSVTVYIWNPHVFDVTFQSWQSITLSSIPDGAVTNSKLAVGAVTDDKVTSVGWSKLLGIPPSFTPGGAAGGDLAGTYPNPVIAVNAVDQSKLQSDAAVDANRAVTNNAIRNFTIAPTGASGKISIAAAAAYMQLRVNAANNALEWFDNLLSRVPIASSAEECKYLRIKADGSAWEYVTDLQIQEVFAQSAVADSTATTIPYDNTIPQQATEGKEYLTVTITPKLGTSKLRIRFNCFMGCTAGNRGVIALFQDATANALQAVATPPLAAGDVAQLTIDYFTLAAVAGVPTTFKIRFGGSVGTGYINQSSTTALFGAAANSSLIVEEIGQN